MTDLFRDRAQDFDARPVPQQISEGVFAAIRAAVEVHADQTVMDFGAGTGLICAKLAPHVSHVHAVDISPAMLAKLSEKPELADRSTIHCQDIIEEPLGIEVDLVVSAMAMHHVENTAALLRALYGHLRPGGTVAIADLETEDGTFHSADMEGIFHHGFDRASLQATMESAGFVDVVFRHATEVIRNDRPYGIFLVTASRR